MDVLLSRALVSFANLCSAGLVLPQVHQTLGVFACPIGGVSIHTQVNAGCGIDRLNSGAWLGGRCEVQQHLLLDGLRSSETRSSEFVTSLPAPCEAAGANRVAIE